MSDSIYWQNGVNAPNNANATLWGVDAPLTTVNYKALAELLQSSLGNLQQYQTDANGNLVSSPFTRQMSIGTADKIKTLLTDLQTAANWGNLETDLNAILTAAQATLDPATGEVWLPAWSGYSEQAAQSVATPKSGGLTSGTASVLGRLLDSLIQANVISLNSTKTAYNLSANYEAALATWLSESAHLSLIQSVSAQVDLDVPIAEGTISVGGVDTPIRVALNKSLQEVLQTEYVQKGAGIVYSGLQGVVNQQQGAEDTIKVLNQLQQVYNSIEAIPSPNLITGLNSANIANPQFKTDLANYLFDLVNKEGTLTFYAGGTGVAMTLSAADYATAADLESAITITGSATTGPFLFTISGQPSSYGFFIPEITTSGGALTASTLTALIEQNAVSNSIKGSSGDLTSAFFLDFINKLYGPGAVNSSGANISMFNSTTTKEVLGSMLDSGNPGNYIKDLPNVLPSLFPEPGATFDASNILINGSILNTAAEGNMQQLINQVYQSYLRQAAQRLLDAANVNSSNIIIDSGMTIDPATGQVGYIVNPNLTGTAQSVAANNLQVIRSVLNYAYLLKVPGGPAGMTYNLTDAPTIINPISSGPVSGPNGSLTQAISVAGETIGGVAYGFGSPQGGGLEDNLRSILSGLVGGSSIIGGSSSVTGSITFSSTDGSLDITKWILGIWPTGMGDLPTNSGIALDQTQSYLSSAFSSASAVNSQLQQELQQAFFLFQQFMQSATDTLSAINQLIVKKAQAISG